MSRARPVRAAIALLLSLTALTAACDGDRPGAPASRDDHSSIARRTRSPRPPLDPADVRVAFRRRCFDPRECDPSGSGPSGNGVFGVSLRRRPPVRLTGHRSDRDPVWSPDGRSLAFARCDGGDCDLWTLDPATGKERRVTSGRAADTDPAWSPGGGRLVFERCDPGKRARNSCELWIAAIEGGDERRITDNEVADGSPDWSWKLGRIVFARGDCPSGTPSCARARVMVMRPDGTRERVLARHPFGAWDPQWDQTRPRIVYDRCRNVCLRLKDPQGSPFVILHLRRGPTVVRSRFESAFAPSFSPDGRRLIYALRSGDDGTVTYLPLDGGPEQTLYGDYYYEAFSPDWRPGAR